MKNKNNVATVAGVVVTEPREYDCCGEKFYSFNLAVKRESGVEDIVPVNMSSLLKETVTVGERLCLYGQIRTYNKTIDGKGRLFVNFFALEEHGYTGDENGVELSGFFCKEPAHRVTPLGRDICDALLAVNRERGKSDYIPIIVWGRTARHIGTLDVGAHVAITGRFQSRTYQKTIGDKTVERTAYEVSVNRIEEVSDDE